MDSCIMSFVNTLYMHQISVQTIPKMDVFSNPKGAPKTVY